MSNTDKRLIEDYLEFWGSSGGEFWGVLGTHYLTPFRGVLGTHYLTPFSLKEGGGCTCFRPQRGRGV
jgi:hypothetical protein